jgi:hypothetical protein
MHDVRECNFNVYIRRFSTLSIRKTWVETARSKPARTADHAEDVPTHDVVVTSKSPASSGGAQIGGMRMDQVVVWMVAAFLIGSAAAARLLGARYWVGAAVAAAGAAGLLGARAFGGLDQTIPFLIAVLAAGAVGQGLGLTAQQTGMTIVGGTLAALLPYAASAAGWL